MKWVHRSHQTEGLVDVLLMRDLIRFTDEWQKLRQRECPSDRFHCVQVFGAHVEPAQLGPANGECFEHLRSRGLTCPRRNLLDPYEQSRRRVSEETRERVLLDL